jgi:hypothetical protein
VGWNLSTSSIEIDTRFGVPKYDGNERYLLDGEELTKMAGTPTGAPTGFTYYSRRNEGRFDWIGRSGTSGNFYWVVTDKSGTKYTYGQTAGNYSGTSTPARLMSTASGGVANAAKSFKWFLEKEEDVFGNQVLYTYQWDTGTIGTGTTKDAFVQVYPKAVTYTAHSSGTPAPQYTVTFNLLSGTRADAFSTARPTFLVMTNKLLDSIDVKNGTNLVRRYEFVYKLGNGNVAGAGGKNLLSSIKLLGKGGHGTNPIAQHDLTYYGVPTVSSADTRPVYFAPPVKWADMKGPPATGASLSDGSSKTVEYGASVGVPGVSFSGEHVALQTQTDRQVEDANGDGLPDLLPGNVTDANLQSLNMSGASPPATMTQASFTGWSGPYSHDSNEHMSSSYNVVVLSGSEDYGNISQDDMFIADVNGDGLPDRVHRSDNDAAAAQIVVEMNLGRLQGFAAPRILTGYNGTGLKFSCTDILKSALPGASSLAAGAPGATNFPSVDLISKWEAPFTGTVHIGGYAQKKDDPKVPGDGVRAEMFKNNTLIWQHDFADNYTANCYPHLVPSGVGTACDTVEPTTGNNISVQASDRIYTRVSALQNADDDVLFWDMTESYVNTAASASDMAAKEPTGVSRYKWSEQTDQRPVGEHYAPWVAQADGVVQLDMEVNKVLTSSDVEIDIGIHSQTQGDHTLFTYSYAADDTRTNFPANVGSIQVYRGDEIHVWITSKFPIDPNLITTLTKATYTSYCRTDPKTGNYYCGAPMCVAIDPSQPNGGTQCTIGTNDPMAKWPVAGSVITQILPTYYPIESWARIDTGAVAPTPDGRKAISISDDVPVEVCVWNSDFGLSGAPFTLAIQGVNKLWAQAATQMMIPGSEFPHNCLSVNAHGINNANQLFVSMFMDYPLTGDFSIKVTVNKVEVPNAAERYYRSPSKPLINHFPWVGEQASMSGGFHNYYTGTWNGNRAFDENMIYSPSDNDSYLPLVIGPMPADTVGAQGVTTANIFGDVFKSVCGFVAGGAKYIWNKATQLVKVVGSVYVGAWRYLASVVSKIVAWALCTATGAGYTVTGIRYSETHNDSEGIGCGGTGIATTTGSTVGGMDMMDMNGDGVLDQVSTAGVRFLDFTSGAFGPATPTVKLPEGPTLVARHKMYTGQVGFSGDCGIKGDMQAADAGGNPTGVAVSGNISARIGHGWTKLERQLRDVNGDGLPDYIKATTSADTSADHYRLSVQLNYGDHFGNPIQWSSAVWSVTSPTQTLLFKGTGVKAILDAMDVLVGSGQTDSSGTIRLQETGHKGGAVGVNASNGVLGGGLGFGMDQTYVSTLVDLVDIDGDGLPDQVLKQPGQPFLVKLNTGGSFATETSSPVSAWSTTPGYTLPAIMFDTGSGPVTADAADSLAFERSDTWDVNANAQVYFAGANGGYGEGNMKSIISMMDVDGDGRLDQVVKNADVHDTDTKNATVLVRLNQSGKNNLLKSFTRPMGGSVTLDYTKTGNVVDQFGTPLGSTTNVDSQTGRFALTTITVDDGRSATKMVDHVDYGMVVNGQTATVPSGNYDRTEKEFYGYARVSITHGDPSGSTFVNGDGSVKRLYFYNQDFHSAGRLMAEFDVGVDAADGVKKVLRGSFKTPVNFAQTPGTASPPTFVAPSSQYPQRVETYDVTYDGRITLATLDASSFASILSYPLSPTWATAR